MSSNPETFGPAAEGGSAAERAPSPFRPDLEQQRKRAKDLLRGLRAGDPDAVARFVRHHPRARGGLPDFFTGDLLAGDLVAGNLVAGGLVRLSEAQLVVARELGLPSWPRLKAHIVALDRARERIARSAAGGAAPDGDMPTLHVRCGSDIAGTLRRAGFAGDFLEYSDPLCQGPVVDAADRLDRRSAFLAEAYGAGSGRDRARIVADLADAEARLAAAPSSHARVVLWFEHDSYDQLILARCLARFADAAPERLELVSIGGFPGGVRFIGLGQLPPDALRLLWDARVPVSAAALGAGAAVWRALRRPDPAALAEIGRAGTPALPELGRAVLRHCRELPDLHTGLGLTERMILDLLAEAPRTVGAAYAALMREREPLPWMSDLMFHATVEAMKRAAAPVFEGAYEGLAAGAGRRWPDERLTITPLGRRVLAGEVDWMSLAPPPRWLGGVEIASPRCPRWDDAAGTVAYR